MIFPKKFVKNHPTFAQNLLVNQNRLTSHFDTYATMKHMLQIPFGPPYKSNRTIGRSFFEPIPEMRTCDDAGIAVHWCLCLRWKEASPYSVRYKQDRTHENKETAQKGTLALVHNINQLLEKEGEGKCRYPLELRNIHHVQYVELGDNVKANLTVGNRITYQTQFELSPGGAVLDGTFDVEWITNTTTTVIPDHHFSRLNEYGEQSCKPKPHLRIFCECKD